MTFILKNWKMLVAIGALVASFFAGTSHTQAKWDLDIAIKLKVAAKAAQENAEKIASLEIIKYENLATINNLSDDLRAVGVRLPTATTTTEATKPEGYDATGSGVVPVAPQDEFDKFRQGLESSALEADLIVEECRVLRDWAKSIEVKP